MGPDAGDDDKRAGLMASLRQLVGSLLEIVQTRIEIVASEIEEEREYLHGLVVQSLLSFLFLTIGLLLFTLFIILVFWDEYRLLVIGGFAAIYLSLGIAGLLFLQARRRHRPRFLSDTVAELKKDREQLRDPP
jgi:uncharacterized membrane protein YqjE